MLLLIEHGDLYDPEPRGTRSLLIANGQVEKIGPVDRRALDALGVEHEVIDAEGCAVVPGLIDPHEHLLGGSGEGSLALQSPELFLREIVRAGITSVVGTLGVDTTMKTIAGLLARVKALEEEGLSAWLWTGGYNVPPTTVMHSIREDLLFVDEVIGACVDNGGPLDRLTISSDTDSTTPDLYYQQLAGLVKHHGFTLDLVLPLVTRNTATALKLQNKGCLAVGNGNGNAHER